MYTLDNGSQHAVAFNWQSGGDARGLEPSEVTQPLTCHQTPAAFKAGAGAAAGSIGYAEELAPTLPASDSGSNRAPGLLHGMAVRRLTPTECERLQGFPDGYTRIPYRNKPAEDCPDGPRYRALGNSMAVPVMRWILRRVMA
jgi:DNA (cytosine-5)-methyltransferase 1